MIYVIRIVHKLPLKLILCSLHNEKTSYSIDHDDNVNMYGAVKWL